MQRALRTLCALSSLALVACGDSLLGGEWLEELIGVEDFPAEVAWELRWYQGPDQPLGVECDLRAPWSGMFPLEEVYFGVAEVPPPLVEEIPEASFVIEGEGFSYGIALLVLFEPEPYYDSDPDRVRTDLDAERGTWGVVEDFAVLVADGDIDALSDELFFEYEEERFAQGAQLVEFYPEVVLGTGAFNGSIYPVFHEESEYLWDVGLPALHHEYMEGTLFEVFEGHPLGGAVRMDCHGDEGA
jgi:hypothetical protein